MKNNFKNNMAKSIMILDEDYRKWVKELKERYRRSQIKAATKVNQEMIQYYWDLGRDIARCTCPSTCGTY